MTYRHVHNKKSAIYANDRDCQILSRLSKAALLDLCTEAMRSAYQHCDTPCCDEEIMEFTHDLLVTRGDRPLFRVKGGAK
jgi:hypothetical protein